MVTLTNVVFPEFALDVGLFDCIVLLLNKDVAVDGVVALDTVLLVVVDKAPVLFVIVVDAIAPPPIVLGAVVVIIIDCWLAIEVTVAALVTDDTGMVVTTTVLLLLLLLLVLLLLFIDTETFLPLFSALSIGAGAAAVVGDVVKLLLATESTIIWSSLSSDLTVDLDTSIEDTDDTAVELIPESTEDDDDDAADDVDDDDDVDNDVDCILLLVDTFVCCDCIDVEDIIDVLHIDADEHGNDVLPDAGGEADILLLLLLEMLLVLVLLELLVEVDDVEFAARSRPPVFCCCSR